MQRCSSITFGKVLGKVETENFEITEAKHSPNYKLPRHAHDSMNLVCVLSGAFVENFSRKEYECVPQTVLFKPTGAIHSNHYLKTGSHTILISIKNRRVKNLGKLIKIFEDVRLLDARENFPIIKKIYREISVPDELSKIALEGLSLELFTNFSRQIFSKQDSNDPKWLTDAKDYIHANFKQKLSLSKVAEEIGTHPSHLARVFRRNFQKSIGDYIRNLRLEFAAELLIKTEKTLAEISAEAGFYDQSHFTNLFKNHYGITPSNYRISKKNHKMHR